MATIKEYLDNLQKDKQELATKMKNMNYNVNDNDTFTQLINKLDVTAKIKPFSECTDEELQQYLDGHYKGYYNLADYWNVGDTRVMHLSAMEAGTCESHVEQDMTMVIVGFNHDDLKEPINGINKSAITLQCREQLGNKGTAEGGAWYGSTGSVGVTDTYPLNPRRTWLNETFFGALPTTIQPLVKTVLKKNLDSHSSTPKAGETTEDKAFLTSYPEMFGSASYSYYKGSVILEGEQYEYYDTTNRRIKKVNNNGVESSVLLSYWLRSPSSYGSSYYLLCAGNGVEVYQSATTTYGIAPAFCL